MRIGMMVDVYKPYLSGVTNHIELSKQYMESQGHEVFVFTFGDNDYADQEDNIIRSPGLSFDVPAVEGGVTLNLRYDRFSRGLLKTMDVVHTHHPFISGMLALRYCKPNNIPILFTTHTRYDLYYQAYLPMFPENLGENLLQVYFPFFCKSCDLIVAPSKGMEDVLRDLGVDARIEVVPNGINVDQIRFPITDINRSELGIATDDVVMIFVGRLGPEKNVSFLLRAFAISIDKISNAKLLFVGSGPYQNNLEQQAIDLGIEDRVLIIGRVDYEDVPGYLKMSDVFVSASISEVHPLTLLEGMAAGLPLLGIQSPGVEDIIEDGETGFLSQYNIDEFSERMRELITDENLRKRFRKASLKRSDTFSIENSANALLNLYTEVIENREDKPNEDSPPLERLRSRLNL